MFDVKVEGLDTITKDYEKLVSRLNHTATPLGLKMVASDMREMLIRHIQEDVYDAYAPTNYIRREENGGMIDEKNIDVVIENNQLMFTYLFPTNPSNWAKTPEPYCEYIDGDDSIRAIQTGGRYPTYGNMRKTTGARPFWSNFVHEFFTSAQADKSFVKGLNQDDVVKWEAKVDRNVKAESQDWEPYSQIPNKEAKKREIYPNK